MILGNSGSVPSALCHACNMDMRKIGKSKFESMGKIKHNVKEIIDEELHLQ